jgi:hypothetical protein
MQAHFAVFFEAAAALFCKYAGRTGEPMPDNKSIAAKAISSTKTSCNRVHLVAAARAARPDLVDDALPTEFLGESKHIHLSPREAADIAPAVVKFIAWLQGPGRGELRKCGSNQAAVLKVIEDLTKTSTRPMGGALLMAGVVADQLGTWARTDFAEPAPELMISGPFQWLDDGHPTKVVGPNNKEQLVHHFVWARPVVPRRRSPLLDCHASVRSAAVARARAVEMVRMRAEKEALLLKELNEQEDLKRVQIKNAWKRSRQRSYISRKWLSFQKRKRRKRTLSSWLSSLARAALKPKPPHFTAAHDSDQSHARARVVER